MYGNRIKKIVKKAGLSQKQVAQKLNVPESTFSNWIKVEYPPLEAIEKICGVMNIELWEFFLDEKNIALKTGTIFPAEQMNFLKIFNQLPSKKRELILEGFVKIVEATL